MREHIKADEPFVREDVPVGEALERFRAEGQDYKVELIEDLVRDEGVDTVSLYTNGPFTDLCRGPHAPTHQAHQGVSSCSRVAGAYWRGDASRQMLTRVYGTAFFKESELDEHLERLEQARARDHRRLGPQLGLFRFSEVAPGAAFWLPPGTTVFNELVGSRREMCDTHGYREVKTPQLYDAELWKTSGHWFKYRDNMFVTEAEDREFGLKPMNCPGHCQLFGMQKWSYRDLPVRYSEPGLLHRNELSGTLHGLLRVRHFVQDDAPHLLHARAGARRGQGLPGHGLRDLRRLRHRAAPRAVDPARRAHRRRRAVGRGRGAAGARARGEGARRTRSTRATARSTARRSTCTSPTRSAAPGSSARCSWTSSCPSASTSPTPAPTTPSTAW